MSYPYPKQPKNAFNFDEDAFVAFNKLPSVFLVDLEEPKMPYSTNGYMLADVVTYGGLLPTPGLDVVVFHSKDIIVCVCLVSALLKQHTSPEYPGRWRALVSCAPFHTVAFVPAPQDAEDILRRELKWVSKQIRTTKLPAPSRGNIPRGALVENQVDGNELVQQVTLDVMVLNF